MSQENVEVVRRGYEALRRHDLHAFLDFMHPDVEGTSRVLEVEGAVYRGREGVRHLIEGIWSVFPDWEPEVAKARQCGDAVVAEIRGTGRGVGSGIETGMTAFQVVKFRDGKVIWFRGYATEDEALETVGLRE